MKPIAVILVFFHFIATLSVYVDDCDHGIGLPLSHGACDTAGDSHETLPHLFAQQTNESINAFEPSHNHESSEHSLSCLCLCHASAMTTNSYIPTNPGPVSAIFLYAESFISQQIFRIERPPRLS